MPAFVSTPGVMLVLLIASVVVALLAIERVDRVVPKGSRLEEWTQRWAPTAQAVVVVSATLWAIHVAFADDLATSCRRP